MPDIFPQTAETSGTGKTRFAGWIEMHLGTRVEIRCHTRSETDSDERISAAFAEIARIHRLMSFHEPQSDVSRLNRAAVDDVIAVDPRTVEVLRAAREISRLSQGHFDITVAPELVQKGSLPRPQGDGEPSAHASWQALEILSDEDVVLHKPLWIDLGGIAKGYAVDRAFSICNSASTAGWVVNAGGDIRVSNAITRTVDLEVPGHDRGTIPRVELCGGSMASSCTIPTAERAGTMAGTHFDGVSRTPINTPRFVSVLAQDCIVADALTKVVLTRGEGASPVLSQYGATALLYDAAGWRQLGATQTPESSIPAYTP